MKTILQWMTALPLFAMALSSGCGKDTPPPPETTPEVFITLASATETSIAVKMVALDATGYTYAIGRATDRAAFEDGTLEGIKVVDAQVDTPKEVTFNDLADDTEYTVFARAYDAKGQKGVVKTLAQRTEEITVPEIPASEITISLIDRTQYTLQVKFTGNETTTSFDYAMGTADDLTAFEAGTLEGIETAAYSAEGVTETYEGLEPGTEYTLFARGKNSGDEQGATKTAVIRTFDPAQVEMEIVQLNNTIVKVKYTPNESVEGGLTVLLSQTAYAALGTTQPEVIGSLVGMASLGAMYAYEGDKEIVHAIPGTKAVPGTKFMLANLVIYLDQNGVKQYQLDTEEVTTPPLNPAAATGTVTVELLKNSKANGVEFKFTTDDAAFVVQHKLLSKTYYDMMLTLPGTAFIDDLKKSGVRQLIGESTYLYNNVAGSTLKAGEVCYLFGIIYNENGPSDTIQVFHEFTLGE